MAFKLTLVLCLFIFVAFYFAPAPEPRVAGIAEQPGTREPVPSPNAPGSAAPEVAAPAAPAETITAGQPEPSQDDQVAATPNLSAITDAAVAEALAGEEDAAGTEQPPLTLGTLSLGEDGATAMSLAESVRSRTEISRQEFAATSQANNRTNSISPPSPSPTVSITDAALPEARINATSVNLRAGPSTSQAVVGRAGLGDLVEIVEEGVAPGWSAIRTDANDDTVYISSQFLDLLD